jgi:hypothetical protein
MVIFAKNVSGEGIRKAVEENCDAIKVAVVSPKCRFGVRFSYEKDDLDEDVLSGFVQRTIVKLEEVDLLGIAYRRRR